MKKTTRDFQTLREHMDTLPVISTHEHFLDNRNMPQNVFMKILGYYQTDFVSASGAGKLFANDAVPMLLDSAIPFEDKFAFFKKVYEKSCHTSYAKALALMLKENFDIDEITPESLQRLEGILQSRTETDYQMLLQKHRIEMRIVDSGGSFLNMFNEKNPLARFEEIPDATDAYTFTLSLPKLHRLSSREDVFVLQGFSDNYIVTLEDYENAFENLVRRAKEKGFACMKDQSAYRRTIDFGNPTRGEAETVFNRIISNQFDTVSAGESRVLDDYLFHFFMLTARKYNMPVQMHTGALGGNFNDVRKANAAHLTGLLDRHRDVRFDLFHGNYPYMGELLLLVKNYPHVYMDLCWCHTIDPLYTIELIKRAIVTVPHSKIMGFGGDTVCFEYQIAHLIEAKNNIAYALSDLIEMQYLSLTSAKEIAADLLYNNPKALFFEG